MPQGYGYGNARLRGMRSRLLTEQDFDNLLTRTTIEEVITALTETPYKEDIEAALVRLEGVYCVFEALRANLTRTLRQIPQFYEGEPRTLVELLLRRWDRHNLLTILRGQTQEVAPETVLSAIVPVGQLDEVSLRELARQPGVRAAIDLMTTWRLPYAKALREVRARTGTVPALDQLELVLNRFHYASLWQALGQGNSNRTTVLEHLEIEVDLINIRTALRLARLPETIRLIQQRYSASDVSPLLIEPGGRVPARRVAELVTETEGLEGMLRGLQDTRYGPALMMGWRRYQAGEGDFTALERELERWQARYTVAMFNRNPLSIAIPMGYIGCKELEVANLRLIAQAVALGINREQVKRELIIV